MRSFLTLAGVGKAQIRIQASRFAALAAPVEDEAAAREMVSERQRAFRDASHHCSAWALRGGTRRADDAGEPAGSAGAPILAAIEGADLADCCVVVTRWFGGTKLGVGGLVRAYGEAAAQAIAAAPRRRGIVALRVLVEHRYEHTGAVMRVLARAGAAEVLPGFTPAGRATVECALPSATEPEVRQGLQDATAGTAGLEVRGDAVIYTLDAPGAHF